MRSRKEIAKANYHAYQKAGKKGRKELPYRLTPVTGMNRDYPATVPGNYGKSGKEQPGGKSGKRKARGEGKRGGRPKKYGTGFVRVLKTIRIDRGRPCGKLPVPVIRETIAFPEAESGFGINAELRGLVPEISPAAADILPKPARKAPETGGMSTTRSAQTPLRGRIPVRTRFERGSVKPGFFALDTVARRGGSAGGQFRKTLTGTDVFSGWIEERALPNAANRRVYGAFSNIRSEIPFPVKGARYDNGMEFISQPLLPWCLGRHTETTRSRPRRKNDNCYAEQKNFDAVRGTAGYFRFDTPAEHAAPAGVYRFLCPLYNYWYPSFKPIDKVKQDGGRCKKVYEKSPETPYQRLLESPGVNEECKAELRRRKAPYNPVVPNRGLNEAAGELLRPNRENVYAENASCREAGQTPAA